MSDDTIHDNIYSIIDDDNYISIFAKIGENTSKLLRQGEIDYEVVVNEDNELVLKSRVKWFDEEK